MSTRRQPAAAELIDRTLTSDEVRAYLETPISSTERDDVLALITWFKRRYPTGAERLAYVRRAYRRWQQNR